MIQYFLIDPWGKEGDFDIVIEHNKFVGKYNEKEMQNMVFMIQIDVTEENPGNYFVNFNNNVFEDLLLGGRIIDIQAKTPI